MKRNGKDFLPKSLSPHAFRYFKKVFGNQWLLTTDIDSPNWTDRWFSDKSTIRAKQNYSKYNRSSSAL